MTGIVVMSYPYVERSLYVEQAVRINRMYDEHAEKLREEKTSLADLRDKMERYNRKLYEEGQSGLKDAWSYEDSSFELKEWGLQDDMMGYVEIPKLGISVPLYLGASEANMTRGAVHLSQTSLPIGGENTNSVLAAHRGYYRAEMFQNIDQLKPGDEIYVTNLWETLRYRVRETKVIEPNEVDQVLIRKGEDLVTLITCHPYPYDYQRYAVYCERDGSAGVEEKAEVTKQTEAIAVSHSFMLRVREQVKEYNGILWIMTAGAATGILFYMIHRRRRKRIRKQWGDIRRM